MSIPLPAAIADVSTLEALLSDPPPYVVDAMARLEGDIMVLGVAGKMGPTLARMAKRATDLAGVRRRVLGVARFSASSIRADLEAHGVEAIQCDLLDEAAVKSLPDAPNIVFMAGRKFGSTGLASLTWAMNCYLPAIVCRRFSTSRIVAFSTGNVYGLSRAGARGSAEDDRPQPVGEYAMSCLGRERIFEHFSDVDGVRAVLLRLNYAAEMRYGVLVDLARRVAAGETIDVSMGYFNVIWQADANAMALAALTHAASPPLVLNIAGPEELSVRGTCEELGRRLGRRIALSGAEAADALLSNGARAWDLFGRPRVSAAQLVEWTADWVARGGASLDKPTHFESRDGQF